MPKEHQWIWQFCLICVAWMRVTFACFAGNVHILECHPTDPGLAFSASYDGTLLLWSPLTGAVLRRFSRRAEGQRWGNQCWGWCVLPIQRGTAPDRLNVLVPRLCTARWGRGLPSCLQPHNCPTLPRCLCSRQTRLDGRSWPDVLPFADGHFSPDGRTITVAGAPPVLC